MEGGPERPFCAAVKLKPELPWRTQGVRNARAVEYLLSKAANREWNKPKRKCVLQSTKLKKSWRSEEHLTTDMEMPS